jgi:hypothetical protein
MTIREGERRSRQRHQSDPIHDRDLTLHRVLGFAEWCALAGISAATARRLIRRGLGPPIVRLSDRRIGIRVSDYVCWLAARSR